MKLAAENSMDYRALCLHDLKFFILQYIFFAKRSVRMNRDEQMSTGVIGAKFTWRGIFFLLMFAPSGKTELIIDNEKESASTRFHAVILCFGRNERPWRLFTRELKRMFNLLRNIF